MQRGTDEVFRDVCREHEAHTQPFALGGDSGDVASPAAPSPAPPAPSAPAAAESASETPAAAKPADADTKLREALAANLKGALDLFRKFGNGRETAEPCSTRQLP